MASEACPRCQTVLTEPANFCVACGNDLRGDDGEFRFQPPDPLVGQVVAERYRLLELVGRGGMGVVYKVEHVQMGKLMAMKLLHGELARDREVVKRFNREATAASRLSHPNTVQVFDFGRSQHLMYLVMEFIEGTELARWVREKGPMPFPRCGVIISQVCSSLAEAHDKGIVHRDLKPENVIVREVSDGSLLVKVLDFGLAKLRETEERTETTMQGVLVGTPHYMSPEQIRGEEIDHRSDIYSLGAMMHKVLCGVPPFKASTPVAVLTRHLNEPPPVLSDRYPELMIPHGVSALVLRCLAKKPSARYQNVEEIKAELHRLLLEAGSSYEAPADSSITRKVGPRKRFSASDELGVTIPDTPDGALRVGNRLIQISSRDEFDAFERKLRTWGILRWCAASLLLLLVVGVAGVYGVLHLDLDLAHDLRTRLALVGDAEREPNDEPIDADLLLSGRPIRGLIGKRLSITESDRDWYLIRNADGRRRVLRATLEPVPRMNLVLQVIEFDRAAARTLAESNDGGVGEGEAVSGVAVNKSDVYVLVREEWLMGRAPTENVSDSYVLRVELVDPPTAPAP
jgi:serine/threonine-protein kinase